MKTSREPKRFLIALAGLLLVLLLGWWGGRLHAPIPVSPVLPQDGHARTRPPLVPVPPPAGSAPIEAASLPGGSEAQESFSEAPAPKGLVVVRVVDETSLRPFGGVDVKLRGSEWREGDRNPYPGTILEEKTDAWGFARLEVPSADIGRVRYWVGLEMIGSWFEAGPSGLRKRLDLDTLGAPEWLGGTFPPLTSGETRRHEFRLPGKTTLAVTVRTSDGQPFQGTLWLESDPGKGYWNCPIGDSLELQGFDPEAWKTLRLGSTTHLPSPVYRVAELPRTPGRMALFIQVHPGSKVEGQVTLKDGSPCPGASVWCYPHEGEEKTENGFISQRAEADKDGRFRLQGLPPNVRIWDVGVAGRGILQKFQQVERWSSATIQVAPEGNQPQAP